MTTDGETALHGGAEDDSAGWQPAGLGRVGESFGRRRTDGRPPHRGGVAATVPAKEGRPVLRRPPG